jgi:hypothetical protein
MDADAEHLQQPECKQDAQFQFGYFKDILEPATNHINPRLLLLY